MVPEKPLLNRAEHMLYGRLVRAFPGHVVLAQVALSRLLGGDEAASAKGRTTDRRGQWVADFVVCRPDFTALAVVDLDHCARPGQGHRPRRQDRLLRSAGVKVVRLAANDIPNELALKSLIIALPLHASTAELLRRAS